MTDEGEVMFGPPKPTGFTVARRVARRYGLTLEDIQGECKDRRMVEIRWETIAAIRRMHPGSTLHQIGRVVKKDHTTVLHALKKMGMWRQ